MSYNIEVCNNLGNFSIFPTRIPESVREFVLKKAEEVSFPAYYRRDDDDLPSLTVHCLRPGMQDRWSYSTPMGVIIIHFKLDLFYPERMVAIETSLEKKSYDVKFVNDMGHLVLLNYDTYPKYVCDFAYSKAKIYVNTATDISGLGCRFYILKDGLKDRWSYRMPLMTGGDTVNIFYDLNKFDPESMKMV